MSGKRYAQLPGGCVDPAGPARNAGEPRRATAVVGGPAWGRDADEEADDAEAVLAGDEGGTAGITGAHAGAVALAGDEQCALGLQRRRRGAQALAEAELLLAKGGCPAEVRRGAVAGDADAPGGGRGEPGGPYVGRRGGVEQHQRDIVGVVVGEAALCLGRGLCPGDGGDAAQAFGRNAAEAGREDHLHVVAVPSGAVRRGQDQARREHHGGAEVCTRGVAIEHGRERAGDGVAATDRLAAEDGQGGRDEQQEENGKGQRSAKHAATMAKAVARRKAGLPGFGRPSMLAGCRSSPTGSISPSGSS